jgi:hypothetical protein
MAQGECRYLAWRRVWDGKGVGVEDRVRELRLCIQICAQYSRRVARSGVSPEEGDICRDCSAAVIAVARRAAVSPSAAGLFERVLMLTEGMSV